MEQEYFKNALKAWGDARQTTIEAISTLAKENEGNIISFDDIDTYTKLRYTKENGVELFQGRGFQEWVSINADENDMFSGAPSNQTLQWLLKRVFLRHDYDVRTPEQDGKRIKKWTGVENEYEYVDYDPKEYFTMNLRNIFRLFLDKVKKCGIKRQEDTTIDPILLRSQYKHCNHYVYCISFSETKKPSFTWMNYGYLVDNTANGIVIETHQKEGGREIIDSVRFCREGGKHGVGIGAVNKTHVLTILDSLSERIRY